jgi:hypothetical protein
LSTPPAADAQSSPAEAAAGVASLQWVAVAVPAGSAFNFNFTVRDVQVEACPLPPGKEAFAPCELKPAWFAGVQVRCHTPPHRQTLLGNAPCSTAHCALEWPVTRSVTRTSNHGCSLSSCMCALHTAWCTR